MKKSLLKNNQKIIDHMKKEAPQILAVPVISHSLPPITTSIKTAQIILEHMKVKATPTPVTTLFPEIQAEPIKSLPTNDKSSSGSSVVNTKIIEKPMGSSYNSQTLIKEKEKLPAHSETEPLKEQLTVHEEEIKILKEALANKEAQHNDKIRALEENFNRQLEDIREQMQRAIDLREALALPYPDFNEEIPNLKSPVASLEASNDNSSIEEEAEEPLTPIRFPDNHSVVSSDSFVQVDLAGDVID